MRNLIAVVMILALTLTGVACAQTLRVGMECNYAPYNWTQTEPGENAIPLAGGGYADGYDVRIAKRVADYLGMDIEIVKTEWDGLIMSVMSGAIDCIIAGMSPTEERMLTIDFTDPYYESDLVIVVRKDGGYADATSLEDFAGATVVGQLNTFHDTVIDQIPDVKHATPMDTFPTMIVAVTAGSVDGYISERPGAESAIATNPDLTYVVFDEGKGFVTDPADTSIAVGVAKGSELTAQINEALATISKEDRLQIMNDALAAQPSAE
ncbi:MAG: transporter substrate-binding domain-containing protein [Eubacteriales bacterium]|nr:transporter substrate-binding domain-containing protein [Eubacteriales bacterium]